MYQVKNKKNLKKPKKLKKPTPTYLASFYDLSVPQGYTCAAYIMISSLEELVYSEDLKLWSQFWSCFTCQNGE